MVVARGWEKEKWALFFNGYRVLVLQDEDFYGWVVVVVVCKYIKHNVNILSATELYIKMITMAIFVTCTYFTTI